MTHALVGRQPIVDCARNIFGYELLFRSSPAADPVSGESATSRVIANTFFEIGLERIVGSHWAFINVTRDFLLSHQELPFPKDRVVLEILEDEVVDDVLIDTVRRLERQGYCLALDDFVYHPRWEPLIPLVRLIKLDVPLLSDEEIAEHVQRLRPTGVKLLAEKVETAQQFESLSTHAFDYFQGYFLSKPKLVRSKRLPSTLQSVLYVVARLQDEQIEVEEIESLVARDVALSYRLLRYINSAFFALPKAVSSIRDAVVFLGLSQIRQWATLLAMSGINDKPPEIMRLAISRGKMCELLCTAANCKQPGMFFTVGLFSALELLLERPLTEALGELPIAPTLRDAITDQSGPAGQALRCTLSYEICEWPDVRFLDIDEAAIREAYLEASEWSFKVAQMLGEPSNDASQTQAKAS